MTIRDNFSVLLRNFRLAEAAGYVASQVNLMKLSIERGEILTCLLRDYRKIVRDALWNEEGLRLLAVTWPRLSGQKISVVESSNKKE